LYETLRVAYLRFSVSSGLLGAAIAFYAVICLAPMAMFIGAILRYLYGTEGHLHGIGEITWQLSPEAAQFILSEIRWFTENSDGVWTNVASVVGFIWAGSRLFDSLERAINEIWPGRRARGYFSRKLLVICMMLAFGALLGTLMFMTTFVSGLREWLTANASADLPVFDKLHLPISSGIIYTTIVVGFFMIYKFVPVQRVPTKSAIAGALFAGVLWQVMTPALGLMIGSVTRKSDMYGALTGVVLYALWAYFGATIVLMGAHLTAAWAEVFEGVGYHPREPREEEGPVGDVQPTPHAPVNAVIIAGGRIAPEFAEAVGSDSKGLIELLGKPSVEYVVEALREVPLVEKIALVGPPFYREQPVAQMVDCVVDEGGNITENLLRAIERLGMEREVLMLTSDMPLVTPEALNDFLSRCPEDADGCYPMTRRKPTVELFPNRLFVYLPLQEGWITHTCIALFRPQTLIENRPFVERFVARRKRLWRAASTLGLGFVLRFLLSWQIPLLRYSMADIAAKLQRITGTRKLVGIIIEYPEVALDIDRVSDVAFIDEYLQTPAEERCRLQRT
jgi:YihY family inner membrane protein